MTHEERVAGLAKAEASLAELEPQVTEALAALVAWMAVRNRINQLKDAIKTNPPQAPEVA